MPASSRSVSIRTTTPNGWTGSPTATARYPPRWRVAGIAKSRARDALLDRAGVVVIPDGMGGFVHNAGLYLVDADGRLTTVFDPKDTDGLRAALTGDAG